MNILERMFHAHDSKDVKLLNIFRPSCDKVSFNYSFNKG